jgi:hypothetical protein
MLRPVLDFLSNSRVVRCGTATAGRPRGVPNREVDVPERQVKKSSNRNNRVHADPGGQASQFECFGPAIRQRQLMACAVQRRRFPAGASPARQPLQPEATGAGMEVTKCLKPSDKRATNWWQRECAGRNVSER